MERIQFRSNQNWFNSIQFKPSNECRIPTLLQGWGFPYVRNNKLKIGMNKGNLIVYLKQSIVIVVGNVDAMWFSPNAFNVKVKKFNQAQVKFGKSNYDSLKVAKCLII